jgi:hypothetical protein
MPEIVHTPKATYAVLVRPVYNNAEAFSFPRWFEINKRELIRWWWDCDMAVRAAGGPAAAADDDFDYFARAQWDIARAGVMQA